MTRRTQVQNKVDVHLDHDVTSAMITNRFCLGRLTIQVLSTTTSYTYSLSIDKDSDTPTMLGHGIHCSTFANDGDKSSSPGSTILTYDLTANPGRL